jgi:nucleoside-diphosphate-sugar epimerase
MRNVVILGGNGALGSSVVERLKKNSSISLTLVVRDKALHTEKKNFLGLS